MLCYLLSPPLSHCACSHHHSTSHAVSTPGLSLCLDVESGFGHRHLKLSTLHHVLPGFRTTCSRSHCWLQQTSRGRRQSSDKRKGVTITGLLKGPRGYGSLCFLHGLPSPGCQAGAPFQRDHLCVPGCCAFRKCLGEGSTNPAQLPHLTCTSRIQAEAGGGAAPSLTPTCSASSLPGTPPQ